MTDLTLESLEEVVVQMMGGVGKCVALHPTHLIVSRSTYNRLMHRPPIAKRRGPRGRRLALKQRGRYILWRMMR